MDVTITPLKCLVRIMFLHLFSCFVLLMITAMVSIADDTYTSTFQSLRDGQTHVSTGGTFELGFFTPEGASNKRYVGIWYKNIPVNTVVWVANRDTPLTDSSGVLKITSPGILVLVDHNKTVWSSNTSSPAQNPVAQLLDSGNLVVIDKSDNVDPSAESFLWQSFDYPGNTLLPGMKLGRNTITGFKWFMSSWKSPQDPSQGNYTFQNGPKGYAEQIMMEGSVMKFRTGPWNGIRFSGAPHLSPNPIYTYNLLFDHDEEYYSYKLLNRSILSRLVLAQDGLVHRYTWIDRTQEWFLHLTAQLDSCDTYALCGAYGVCNIENSPACGCLKGFSPKYPKDWEVMDWSNGCVRKTPLSCNGDIFQKYYGVKLPSTEQSWFNTSMNIKECEMKCTKNCSCTAYSNLYISQGGTGCRMWFGDLIDITIRNFTKNGEDLYIRMAASELPTDNTKINGQKVRIVLIITSMLSTSLLIFLTIYLRKKQHQKHGKVWSSKKEDLELPLFDVASIIYATNNFSENNKLGQGGFGSVFKGMLRDGREVAVKRLSKHSRQGLDEFKNEIMHIAKLQHRNLVKLHGCCIQEDEMILIYEFMPNKSLDFFIFDHTKSMSLDWRKRFDIINGIARGLLYLHQDSRLRVIHRDLKAGNILLDSEFIPKISDFGLARSLGGNETRAETNRVVGTYGYMSPEYAIDGFYSTKSDVFSFGVSVLEIISGKRNRGFYNPDHSLNLLGHAWKLYTQGRSIELLDTSVGDSTIRLEEVLRSVHVGLLCVQQNPEDRPSMSAAVLMLSGEGALPQPQKPGFYTERNLSEIKVDAAPKPCSANEVTFTLLEAR
ncbi:G-type lectin S-receptor-like serine/threonine-protein kinase At4g27290 isoform X1 [Rosa chinensis]|uniref:G-type lectin S-receptor-like serine/threonine-protein kinase At4g27290 isoform X1 n=1 Tax=Rosa chinensis TaxID=74649 RepID=UPI000D09777B|nr:G-type lectin S-receptor-like serine/threonine-protein kinase At4g27290 isoform X1 [Rosa chinensis]